MTSHVVVTSEAGVRTISIDRPEVRNALAFDTVAGLASAFAEAIADPRTRCIVLTGRGGAFCSGADLKAIMQAGTGGGDGSVDDRIQELHAIVSTIRSAPLPVIASVDGPAVGFGCDLALACDMRIVSTRAYFAEIFVRIGLVPDGGGTFLLPRLVGLARAFELVYTGERVSGEEAVRIGLANRAVDAADLPAATAELAARIARGPALALRLMKECLVGNLSRGYAAALDEERRAQLRCLASGDLIEGVGAFFEKREPRFTGGRD